ncbi:MAG TPA: M20/M25/M40 family metallo-hydrolase [Polyangiaceae bacterium]|nr:M20/M25/M40 family metallo-hydrolase [Polyangiaceae bacterium]
MRSALAVLLCSSSLAACARPAPPLRPPTPAPAQALSFADETRAVLDDLVQVDTSHGRETDALRPLADKLRGSLPLELVESSPGHGNLVARYRGNGAKKPLLLIAHVDVVPVEGQPWTVPPFRLTEKDGFLWGRGVNDDKGMAAAMVAIALELVRSRPVLSRDVIFALTSGEETGGVSGAQWLAHNRRDLIDPEIALNEGGLARLDDDGNRVIEVGIGAAEKTFQDYRLAVRGSGGHSSVPPTDADPVLTLARALVKVGEFRFPARVLPAEREELAADARVGKPPVSDAEARAAATGEVTPDDERVLSRDRMVNAHLRTTCVTTQLEGSPQDNVLPTSAQATVNCRILPDETPEQTLATLKRVVGDPAVEIAPVRDFGYGPYSALDSDVEASIRQVAAAVWPDSTVIRTMGTGATDSRHLRAIGIRAYGVSVSPTTKAEAMSGHAAHGPDERRPAKWLADGARFLMNLTYALAK